MPISDLKANIGLPACCSRSRPIDVYVNLFHLRPPSDPRRNFWRASLNTGDKNAGTTYTISQLAREFDVTTRAIRFYEDQGLLIPERIGRRRIYGRRDRTRLKLILRGKRLGMTLGETRELFDLFDSSRDEARQLERFLRILGERRDILVQQQHDIEAVLHEINAAAAECERLLAEHAEASPQDSSGPTIPA